MQCLKSEVDNGLGTDQRGGETSSAGVVEAQNLPRGAALRLPRRLQTPRSFTDGPESG